MANFNAPRIDSTHKAPGVLSRPTKSRSNETPFHRSPLSYSPIPLSAHQFTPLRKLGKGGFGTVYHVRDSLSGHEYALTIVDKSTVKPQHVDLILREQLAHQALSALDSPSYLPMHASWHDTGCFYMLTVCFHSSPRSELLFTPRSRNCKVEEIYGAT